MSLATSPTTATRLPSPGEIVHVRQRQYLVERVDSAARGECTVVALSCVEDDAQGEPLEVLWEIEPDAAILTGNGWEGLARRGFDAPRLFSAYLHTLRWNCVTATNARLFQAPFRAGIKIEAYQIEPLRKALLLPRVNLFIADDVGLGKTIEAGLIARELLLRKKVREIVVVCPPSVLQQWQGELEQRFGLGFEILDRDYVLRVRRERGYATNPWKTHSRFLVSHRLLIDEDYAAPLRDWLGNFQPGSLLILDEAHYAAPATSSRYAIDSKITRAMRDLAPRFEHRLFLSATPHNGHSNSFSALLEILDPQRFCRGVPVKSRKLLDDVMVRRLKEDIRLIQGGFPERKVVQLDIDGLMPDAPELKLSALLDEYRRLREDELRDEMKRVQAAAAILIIGLQQRLLSSIEAFARTLRVHRRTLERQKTARTVGAARDPRLFDQFREAVGADDDRAVTDADSLAQEEESQVEAATEAAFTTSPKPATERLLDAMTTTAEAARGLPDARVKRFLSWAREHLCPGIRVPGEPAGRGKEWATTRVLVFTEFEATLTYLREQIDSAVAGTDLADMRVAIYRGSTPEAEREAIKRAFMGDPNKYPVRILLCTDAAREGINLQQRCADLFHFDVPWNPSRMEQRNGRIDRKLQPSSQVRCHYFVYRQRPEDRILRALVRKTDTIKRELGSLSQVIEGKLADTLISGGIRRDSIEDLEQHIDTADLGREEKEVVNEELEAVRDRQKQLGDQVDRLRDRVNESRKWVGLEEDDPRFRDALSAALGLLKEAPLATAGTGHLYRFPALDAKAGGDASWANTLDTLRTPRERGQSFWEWRRESPMRPVVFTDPGEVDSDVVHLHLEHPIVRRLLGRFIAQGFVHDDISRACFAQTSDAVPRVILLGRLCLYGAGAARLHEELIAVTARWVDPDRRRGPLSPYGRESEGNTLDLLEKSLAQGVQPANETVFAKLRAAGAGDVRELLPHLESRGAMLADEARKKLAARGKEEAVAMRQILEGQRKRIEATVAKKADLTKDLFNDDERRQLEADRTHWGRRLAEIGRELAEEPNRIRDVYDVKAQRVEPVGLAYLWPVTG